MIHVAMAELDQTVKEFNGDESRLYLAGFSLGGYGVWTTAAMYPGKFAAIVPMSGRVLPRPAERKNVDPEILKLADEPDPYAAFANKIGKAPVWIFHVCRRCRRLRWRIRTGNIRQNEDQGAKKSYKGHKIRRFIFESQTVLRIYLSRFCEQYLSFYDDKT